MTDLRLLACQIEIPETRSAAARDAHLVQLEKKILSHAKPGQYDLIVLPELSSIEYSEPAFKALDQLEEPLAGPSYDMFSDLARRLKTVISFGFPHRGARGRHISQGIMGPDGGLVGRYDKIHIAQFGASSEAPYFSGGESLLTVDVAGFRIAPLICYDIRFPDLTERLRKADVDLVIQSGAYGRDFSFSSWHAFARVRAIENQIAWLGLNRAGDFWGGSIWVPDGNDPETIETLGTDETFASFTLNRERFEQAAKKMPLSQDRRSDYDLLPIQKKKLI